MNTQIKAKNGHMKKYETKKYFFEFFVFFFPKNGTLVHHPSKLCLDVEGLQNNDQVKLKKCELNKISQQWLFENYSTS